MTTAAPLPTADRLARGDLNRYLFGQQIPHRLRSREWPAYEQAKQRGFLIAPSGGQASTRLRNCYWRYCVDLGRPYVVAELRRTWASIEMDLIELPPRPGDRDMCWKLSDTAYKRVDVLLGEMTRPGANWSNGHVYCYSTAVPATCVAWLAERLFAIACADLRGER